VPIGSANWPGNQANTGQKAVNPTVQANARAIVLASARTKGHSCQ
jgi:hypothetical protein